MMLPNIKVVINKRVRRMPSETTGHRAAHITALRFYLTKSVTKVERHALSHPFHVKDTLSDALLMDQPFGVCRWV